MRKKTTINYLSNNELLYELNESKKSFSYFIDDMYGDFTVIVNDLSEIDDELIESAKVIKATQKNENLQRAMIKKKLPKKEILETVEQNHVSPEDIHRDEIVFRLMTYDHVPDEVQQVKKTLLNRIKFPPFKHYAYIDNELKEVGRSHWVGGLENGVFSVEQGTITRQLVKSIIMIVNRYSSKPNFSGYCVDDTTEALTQRGWLRYDEIIEETDKILSMDPETLSLIWSPINDMYVGEYEGNMFHLTGSTIDALVTPGHKFLDSTGNLKPIEDFTKYDSIVTMGDYNDTSISKVLPDRSYSSVGINELETYSSSVPYNGVVWCPKTDYGTFVCRRGSKVYVTGNTYLDDMKAQALLQLSVVAIQFDESKSRNVFAWWSSTIGNSFLKVLKSEKKHRTIRDELMQEEIGMSSFAYQLDHEDS